MIQPIESPCGKGMDHTQILSQLFVGSHPQTIHDINKLQRESRITAVLNLQTDDDMCSANLTWEPLEAHYKLSGIELWRVPVKEEPINLREKVPECARTLDWLLASGHTVYLHCTAGVGRSPTVAIAYLHWCLSWGLDAAVAYVKQLRQCSPHVDAIRLASWDRASERNAPRRVPSDYTP